MLAKVAKLRGPNFGIMPGSLDKVTLPVSHSSQTTEHCMRDAKTLEGYGRPAAQSLRWIVTLSDNVDLRYPHERYKPSFFVYKSYEILNYSLTYLQFGDFLLHFIMY